MNFDKSEEMVKRHVLAPATQLIAEMNNHEEYHETLNEIAFKYDYINPVIETDYAVEKHDDGFWLTSEYDDDGYGFFLTAEDPWEEACMHIGLEPYIDEAYEHYIVSDVLAHQLTERGEMVVDFFGVTIWGRCASGSAVFTDDVMVDISKTTTI